jgi:hypothetical protein
MSKVRYSGRVISFQCRRNEQTATHGQQAFFNVPEVKQLWMMLTFLMPPTPQSPSMLPQQHRHLDNCSTSSVDKKPWHFKLPVPISHLRPHPPPLVYSNGTWTMNFMLPKARTFHASCHVHYQHPWGRFHTEMALTILWGQLKCFSAHLFSPLWWCKRIHRIRIGASLQWETREQMN